MEALGKELGGLAGLPEGGDAEGVAEEEDVGAGDDGEGEGDGEERGVEGEQQRVAALLGSDHGSEVVEHLVRGGGARE